MRLIANSLSTLLIAILAIVLLTPSAAIASESETVSSSADPSEFLTSDGRFDIDAARRAGFEGSLNLEGFDVRIDPETGEPLLSPAGVNSVEASPDDVHWASGFGLATPGMEASILALTMYDGRLIAAGNFITAGGISANRIAAWDGSQWSALGSGLNNRVYALTVYGDDLIAGGSFTNAGGVSASYIAVWDGSNWSSMAGTGMNDLVRALTVHDGQLIAGGRFTLAGGVSANRIASWNGSSWSALGDGMNESVDALITYQTDLIAGGWFTVAGGQSANNIARWDGSDWKSLGTGTDNDVYALTVYNNTLVVGGWFNTAGSVSANNIAAWDGFDWYALGSGVSVDDIVEVLFVYESRLIAGGDFGQAGGVTAKNVAAWDGVTWSAVGSGMNNSVHCMAVYEDWLIAGGNFTDAGGRTVDRIAAWAGTDWGHINHGLNNDIHALVVYDDMLIAGGKFTQAGGIYANFIAAWDGSVWLPLGIGMNNNVYALAAHEGLLYAGGAFTEADSMAASHVAVWDGTVWSPLGSGTDGTAVWALEIYDGKLIAGGYFMHAGGLSASCVAAWDPTGSTWSRLRSGVNTTVMALTVYDNKLIVGGGFTEADGEAANNIALWDGSTSSWSTLGSGMNDHVYALTTYDNDLIAGGKFTVAGGVSADYVAAWDGTTSTWSDLSMDMDWRLSALTVYNDLLIAGGWFNFVTTGGPWAHYIAAWDGSTWAALGSGTADGVVALAEYETSLYAGGGFLTAGEKASRHIARWDKWADTDGDGIRDHLDACPNDPDNDADGDGFCSDEDNCPDDWNPDQGDYDGDGIGNECDNCPVAPNSYQEHSYGWIGDACFECPLLRGDFDNSGVTDGDDLAILSNFVTGRATLGYGYYQIPMGLGESDDYETTTISDVIVLGDYLQNSGPTPVCPSTLTEYIPNESGSYEIEYDGIFPAGATSMTLHINFRSDIILRGIVLPLEIMVNGESPDLLVGHVAYSGLFPEFDTHVITRLGSGGKIRFMGYSLVAAGLSPRYGTLLEIDIGMPSASPSPRPIAVNWTDFLLGDYVIGEDPMVIQQTQPGTMIAWRPTITNCGGICDNTFVGSPVSVDLSPEISLTFSEISQDGATEFSINDCNPEEGPPNINIPGGNYYCISTTAQSTGPIQICIELDVNDFDEGDIPFLQLWHCNDPCDSPDDWENITSEGYPVVDGDVITICGETDELSPFVVGLPSGCCTGIRGNANGDESENINISDITYLVDYLFGVPELGPAPPCPEEGNANGDTGEQTNISDITYLVEYLFGVPELGPPPPACP